MPKYRCPMKYIENNLVFNHDGECFAYYEMIPYNYSFLSVEEKLQLHHDLRQMIVQNGDGKMHALQIATQKSIVTTQEQSKQGIVGNLAPIAKEQIDRQTDQLMGMLGEYQVDYRCFIGFKLSLTEQEVTVKGVAQEIKIAIESFVGEVNNQYMGDCLTISVSEVERFGKMEQLLQGKLSGRFRFRRLTSDDFGYLLEHLHGNGALCYDDYAYQLPTEIQDGKICVRQYELLKPMACLMEEKQRYLKIMHENQTEYAAYFTIHTIVDDLPFPSGEILYQQQQQFGFPVDTSINVEIISNKKALGTVRKKKAELKDLESHIWESNNETGKSLQGAMEAVTELEGTLEETQESMYECSYVVRVSASSLEELKKRCDEVRDFYDDRHIKLVRPFGDMMGLHGEFIPASKRYMNDYVQRVTSDFIASLGFGATQMLGEKDGVYIGFNPYTGRNVYVRPDLAAQGVSGSVTNALAMAFVGSLGGGKSFCNNLLLYHSVLRGARALIIDPKSERGKWREKLPEMGDEINIVNLTSEKHNKGLLDPYQMFASPKDAESLAIDILTFLTGISSRDGEKFPILRKAIRNVTTASKRGLLCVIDQLREQDTLISHHIAEHIESFVDYDFAQLLFSDGTALSQAITLDKQINIIQIADLVLPDSETKLTEYTTMEMLSIAMLLVVSTFALEFIHTDRTSFKIVNLDEAWSILQVAQGKVMSNKLVRAGRSMNAGSWFVTQQTGDLSDEKMKNNIGLKFAFRSTDPVEVKNTLRFFGVDPEDEGNQQTLKSLENGQCLFCDLYGRVGVVQFQYLLPHLFDAFDTRPPVAVQEGGDEHDA